MDAAKELSRAGNCQRAFSSDGNAQNRNRLLHLILLVAQLSDWAALELTFGLILKIIAWPTSKQSTAALGNSQAATTCLAKALNAVSLARAPQRTISAYACQNLGH